MNNQSTLCIQHHQCEFNVSSRCFISVEWVDKYDIKFLALIY